MILVLHLQFDPVFVVFDVGSGYFSVHGIFIADDVGMSNGGVKLLQRCGIAHPIGNDLTQPTNALWTVIELAGHVSTFSCVFLVKSTSTSKISRFFGF